MSHISARTTLTPNDPVFILRHPDDGDGVEQIVSDNYEFKLMPGGWSLGFVKEEIYEQFLNTSTNEFKVGYMPAAEASFGYLDDDFKVISRDKASRFYKYPEAKHFFGLMLGYSLVDSEGNVQGLDWVEVEDERNCWIGDLDSVILNLVMPKDGGGACGCGDNYGAVVALGCFMNTQRNHPMVRTEEARDEALKSTTYDKGVHGDAMLFIGYVLDAAGFTEHGGSVYHGWLEERGVLLAFLIAFSIDEANAVEV